MAIGDTTGGRVDRKHPRTFISYSHDSPEHETRVRGLAERLVKDGVDCVLDLWEVPFEGWPQWMERQVKDADFVLVVGSAGYLAKTERQKPELGRGVKFENFLVLQSIYNAGTWNEKFVPVLVDDLPQTVLPLVLQAFPFYPVFLDTGYKDLLGRLTGQPAYVKPPLGDVAKVRPAGLVSGDGPSGVTVAQAFEHIAVLLLRIKQFSRPARSDVDFPVTLSVSSSYRDLLAQEFVAAGLTPSALLDRPEYSDILIHSPGGVGKTKYLVLLVEEAIRRGWVPFYLDLKHGVEGKSEGLPGDFSIANLFEAFSVSGREAVFSGALAQGWQVLLFVDGLNELQRDKSTDIARLLDKLSRGEPKLRIIAADRMIPYLGMETFVRARIDPLLEPFVRSQLPAGTPLSLADLHLLSVPFFLDLRLELLESHAGGMGRAEMLDFYFSNVAGMSIEMRRSLAKQAYRAYERFRSRSFERDWWTDSLPPGLAAELEGAGVTVPTKRGAEGVPRLVFRHQLFHDFLVGGELSTMEKEEWTDKVLDKATFVGNSIECLSFAGELLGAPRADGLVESIYDWNYAAAIDTISDLQRAVAPSPISRDVVFAIIALNAEKRFDPFEMTALGSERRVSALLPNDEVKAFLVAKTHSQVLDLVSKFHPGSELFREWRRVFLLAGRVEEKDVRTITASPMIGWTAANSLRRCALRPPQLALLRGMIYGAETHGSLRWRAAHVLGAFPSRENVDLLLELAVTDAEFWVKYGATRSLFEIVSKPSSPYRKKVLAKLWGRLPYLENDVLVRQMRVGVFISGAGHDWYQDVSKLVEGASQLPLAQLEKDQWNEQLALVKERATPRTG
jgi:TIR domain